MFRARQESNLFLRKLLLGVLFLICYLCLCRFEEFVFMRRWDSYRLVDPSSLNIRTLTSVLACRGIHARGVFEREDLLDIVRSSGPLTNLEVSEAILAQANPLKADAEEEPKPEVTDAEVSALEFSSLAEFDMSIEEKAWVIEVRQENSPIVSPKIWYRLSRFLKPFNIRMGRLLCHSTEEICRAKKIIHSGLLLVIPKDRSHQNETIFFSWFPNIVTIPRILNWLESKLAKRVQPLNVNFQSFEELKTYSLASGDFIIALKFDRLKDIPLLFSALSIHFDGLVRFWWMPISKARALLGSDNQNSTDGTFFFVNGDNHYEYGRRPEWSEVTTYRAIEFFLRTNYPDSNDVLKVLVLLVCMLALMSIIVNSTNRLDHTIVYCVRSFLIYVYFFIFYLPLSYIFSTKSMHHVRAVLLALYQKVTLSEFGGILRSDYLAGRFSFPRLIFVFISFIIFLSLFTKKRHPSRVEKKPKSKSRKKKSGKNLEVCNNGLSRSILRRECCICKKYCRLDEILRTLACGHVFHQRCIMFWLVEQTFCPDCHFPVENK